MGDFHYLKKKILEQRGKYSMAQRAMAKILFEADGLDLPMICEQVGLSSPGIVRQWANRYGWIRNSKTSILESVLFSTRLEKANLLGLSEVDQLKKAKELMEAESPTKLRTTVKDKDGKTVKDEDGEIKYVEVTEMVPDWKAQNEGLRRAMELTGTKVSDKTSKRPQIGQISGLNMYQLPRKNDDPDKPDETT